MANKGKTPSSTSASSEPTTAVQLGLDRYDVAILSELQKDGHVSNAELAERIGLSAAPTWRRVKQLEEAGFIVGYKAVLNRQKLGLGVMAFVKIDAERDTAVATRELEEAIKCLPEVVSCHYISGEGTFVLQVLAPDMNYFSRFSQEVLLNLPHVKDLHTSFSLGEVKSTGTLPLTHLRS